MSVVALDRALLGLLVLLASFDREAVELEGDVPPLTAPLFAETLAAAAAAVEEVVVGEKVVALAAVAVLGDAVQRLLLYVYLLSCRAEFVHAFSRLVRDIVQRFFRLGEDFVCAVSCGVCQFLNLRVQLSYHPLQALAPFACIGTDIFGKHIFHVPVEWYTLHLHSGFLPEQCFAGIGWMWHVTKGFIH